MTEADFIRKKVRPYLEGLGARVIKYHGGPFSEVGVSDLLVCFKGRFYCFECKVGKNKPEPVQLLFIKQIQKAGGDGGVIYPETWQEDVNNILGI